MQEPFPCADAEESRNSFYRLMKFLDITNTGYKSIALFAFLLLLPNALGLLNIATPWGFNIHIFQLAIFTAAIIYGPKAGLLSGMFGSLYSSIVMANPYIAVGNAVLGYFFGAFVRKNINAILAVLMAYAIQLPWLVATDYYLVHLPVNFIAPLIIALLASNLIWAAVASRIAKPLKAVL